MMTVEEALRIVMEHSQPLQPRSVSLRDALGLQLAEPVDSDLDLPPFDKALMDGYAIRSMDVSGDGPFVLREGERITAGDVPTRPLRAGEAAIIMTGAPLPEGADCVVPHERTTRSEDGRVTIPGSLAPESSILRRAREMAKGERLFKPGVRLDAIKIGVLAAVGKEEIRVVPRPLTVVVPTGDELVTTSRKPGPGQIRETNSAILRALASPFGPSIARPIACDDLGELRRSLQQALDERPDVMLVCGGVSAGQKDLVPGVLDSLGFEAVFHKVKLKPGKPLLFARPDRSRRSDGPLVFGLPGNPVSGIIGFLLFVRPVLQKMLGGDFEDHLVEVELDRAFEQKGDRPTYHPAAVMKSVRDQPSVVNPLSWAGSADLMTVARSDGFVVFPEGGRSFSRGDRVPFLPLPR